MSEIIKKYPKIAESEGFGEGKIISLQPHCIAGYGHSHTNTNVDQEQIIYLIWELRK